MKKIIAIASVLALSACGGPVVKDGDLKAKLESMGYSKVLIRKGKLNCGQFGSGKHFLGTKKDGTKVIGQICYKKAERDIQYKVDINQVINVGGPIGAPTPTPSPTPATSVPNPWKKS